MATTSLPYEIAHCSSWDEDHSPEQLVSSSPGNRQNQALRSEDEEDGSPSKIKGWQTPKYNNNTYNDYHYPIDPSWLLSRCPHYPQDLIIHLLCGPAHISKIQILSHHYKIATKLDVYVGVLKDGLVLEQSPEDDDDDMLIEFTRLGYVCLDNNMRAQFRARELKSIKVNADGEYIRLVIRNCHRNRLNTYNQVGLLALNVQGQPLRHSVLPAIPNHMAKHLQHRLDETSILSSSTRRTSVSSNHSLIHRFSVEDELEQWISALLRTEEEAVRDKAYQLAETCKLIAEKFHELSEFVRKLQVEKRHAIEAGDYDEAEKIKADMNEIKQNAETVLKQAGLQITPDGFVVPLSQSYSFDDMDVSQEDDIVQPSLPERQKYDTDDNTLVSYEQQQEIARQDRLYDAIERWTSLDVLSTPNEEKDYMQEDYVESPTMEQMLLPPCLTSYSNVDEEDQMVPIQPNESTPFASHDERRVSMFVPVGSLSSSIVAKHQMRKESLAVPVDPETIPEPLIDEERSSCLPAIHVFGEEIVSCVLSVKIKCRERGLAQVSDTIRLVCQLASEDRLEKLEEIMGEQYEDSVTSEESIEDYENYSRESVKFVKAALMMIQEAIMDSRESIFTIAVDLWKDLDQFCVLANMPHRLVFSMVERAFSGLLMRTNDQNMAIRQPATELVLTLAENYCTPPYSLLSLFAEKPKRVIHNHKDAKARIELVAAAVNKFHVTVTQEDGFIFLDKLMEFVVTYLNHSHEDVRAAAVELVVAVSKQVSLQNVSKYIDEDLKVTLTETVRKYADAKEQQNKKETTPATGKAGLTNNANAVAELRALAAQANAPKKSKVESNGRSTRRAADSGRHTATGDKKSRPTTGQFYDYKPSTTRGTSKTAASHTTKKQEANNTPEVKEEVPTNENSLCIFCDEINPDFNEETIILHYYNDCRSLASCPACKTIVEVATLTEHCLQECSEKNLMKQCERCKTAVPVEQWLQHSLKKTCPGAVHSFTYRFLNNLIFSAVSESEVLCPLCFTTIDPPTEGQWKAHLLEGSECPKNPRSVKKTVKVTPNDKATTNVKPTTTINEKPKEKRTATTAKVSSKPSARGGSLKKKK
ncbi:hypothetical protein EC973_003197 [Apophysomyces ossiformis]|uniref:TOG domain-containing protein n=1 Tax=Apophysomyces ossiformis TaxID=679940 RepID=A0A8H7BLM0_9FUNG|nr:hypothetical protein EC973_003197 [Apophysomyces ossiformis]